MKIHDPVEAIFSALYWGPVRVCVGIVGIIAVFTACAATGHLLTGSEIDIFFVFSSIVFMFIGWGEFGMLALLGVASGVLMWGSLHAFVVTDSSKGWFFTMLTAALVYFGPLAGKGRWGFLFVGYAVVTLAYWGIPIAVARRGMREEEATRDKIEREESRDGTKRKPR